MKFRKIPGTSIEVSEIGCGVWTLAYDRSVPAIKAHHLLQYALDRGINFFETSESYDEGRGETLIGDALYRERDRTVLATRFRVYYPNEFSPKIIRRACEQSLKRFRTDRIDLYQIDYSAISTVAADDLYATLEKLKKQGKIRFWGCALEAGLGWLEEGMLLMKFRETRCFQIKYQPLRPELGWDIFEDLEPQKAGFIAAMPFYLSQTGHGLAGSAFFEEKFFTPARPREWFESQYSLFDELDFLPVLENRSRQQTLLQFVLANPAIVSTLTNLFNEKQINEVCGTCECPQLSPQQVRQIRALYAKAGQTPI